MKYKSSSDVLALWNTRGLDFGCISNDSHVNVHSLYSFTIRRFFSDLVGFIFLYLKELNI